jgi:hypothetical protein
VTGLRALVIAFLLWIAFSATPIVRAEMPLLRGVEEAKSVGPKTQAVDRDLYQRVCHVSAAAQHANGADGSRERPFATPAAALEAIAEASASARHAILVAAGDYHVVNLRMKPFVDLLGGFDSDWNRDIEKNATVLDARSAGPVVYGANDAAIDGFVITGGRHKGAGGGIICNHVSPTISNNIIRGNATVAPDDFPADMIHQRGSDGGGIAILADANPVVRNNLICQNTTGIGNGGGIFVWNHCSPKITSNVICANETGKGGRQGKEGSRSSNGGGIAVSFDCAPIIAGNVIAMNTVADNSDGGGIYLEYDANAQIGGNWIVGNFGQDDGGGMYVMKNSQPVVEFNVFAGNRNTSGGSSGIRLSKEGRLRASHNLFAGNPNNILDAVGSWMVLENNTFVDDVPEAQLIYENTSEHYAASRITGNVFAGKMKQAVLVKPGAPHPPIISQNALPPGVVMGEQNTEAQPIFIDDSLRAAVAGQSFDSRAMVTTLKLKGTDLPPDSLRGRVVRAGERWSIVRSNDSQTIQVWGDVTSGSAEVLIQETHQQAANSPCRHLGAYAPKPGAGAGR